MRIPRRNPTEPVQAKKESTRPSLEDVNLENLIDLDSCQLCGSKAFVGLDMVPTNDVFRPALLLEHENVGWNVCKNCCVVFQSPRIPQARIERYYRESGYLKVRPNRISDGYIQYSKYQLLRFDPWLRMNGIDLSGKQGMTCLDFGCGLGGAFEFMVDRGNRAFGVELDPLLIEYGNKNFRVNIVENLSKLPPNCSYDLIFTHHSLEHIYDPNEFFEFAAKNLNENGILIILVAAWRYANNIGCFEYFNSAHNCLFDHVSLGAILNKHGFFMPAHLYQNLVPGNDWEICAIAYKSPKRNYYPFDLQGVIQELKGNIAKRDADWKVKF